MAALRDRTETGLRAARLRSRYRRLTRRLRRFPWALAGILFLLSVSLAAGGILYQRGQVRHVREAYERAFPAGAGEIAVPAPVPFEESELYAALKGSEFVVMSLVLALILSAAGGVFMVWYRQLNRLESRHLLTEVERLAMAQRYEFLSRYAHDVIFLLDEEFRVVEANDRAADVYGYTAEEMCDLKLDDLLSPEAAAGEKSQLLLVKKRDGHVYETFHRKKSGASFPAEVSVRMVEAGGTVFTQYIVRDISERKAVEAELQKHREHLEEIVAERTEALRVSNDRLRREDEVRRLAEGRSLRQGRLLRGINRIFSESLASSLEQDAAGACLEEAMALTGCPAGFVEGRSPAGESVRLARAGMRAGDMFFSSSGDESRLNYHNCLRFLEQVQREGKSVRVNEFGLRAAGEGAPFSASGPSAFLCVPLLHDGAAVGAVGLADKAGGFSPEDQSDVEALAAALAEVLKRKRSELTIRKLNAELAGRVMELTAANQELDAFSYSVAHDLRAPLRAVAGFAGLLAEEYGPALDEEARRRLDIIGGNVRMMNDLLDKLLSLSRLSRQPLALSRIDVAAMVRDIFEELKSQAAGRDLVLEIGPVPPCRGDKNLIRQVLFNLLSNAVKFTGPRPRAELKFSGERGGSELIYTLQDNGVGFDQHYAHKLFGVFQRLHSPGEFEGTGVGLSIVQRIIRRHGGRVWAEGVVDRGAAFSFSLPRDLLADDDGAWGRSAS